MTHPAHIARAQGEMKVVAYEGRNISDMSRDELIDLISKLYLESERAFASLQHQLDILRLKEMGL